MNGEKSKASFFNMLSAIVYQIIAAVGGFIIPGRILVTYDASIHGYISTVSNVIIYVSLVTAGLAPAAIQAYYEPIANNDEKAISQVYCTVKKFYNKAGVYYMFCLLGVGIVLSALLYDQIDVFYIFTLLLVMGFSGVLECFLYSRCRVLLLANQNLYWVTFIDSVAYLFRIVMQLMLINCSCSIILVMSIPMILTPIRSLFLSKIVNKQFHIDETVPVKTEILNKRYSAFIHQITSLIVLNTDVVLLTIFGDLIQVSIYSVYNLVFASFYSLLTNMFKNGTVASFGKLLYEDKAKIKDIFSGFEYIYYIIVSIIYSCCGVLILPFVRLYTVGQNIRYDNIQIATLFLIIGITNNIRVPADTIITAAGHFNETKWRAMLEAAINLTISLLLIHSLGIVGILCGTLISFLYRSIDIVIYTYKNILNIKLGKCIYRIARMLICITICVNLGNYIVGLVIINTWIKWFVLAVIVLVYSGIATLAVNYLSEPKIFIIVYRRYIVQHLRK